MAQLIDFQKVRRRMWRKRLHNLLFLAGFAAIVFGVSFLVYHNGNMDLRTAVNTVTAEFASGSGYPVVLPGGRLLGMSYMDNGLIITADSNLYTYNNTGRRMLDVQHGMINPTISVAGSRFLAYDRGGTKVMLFSRSNQLRQVSTDFAIYDGDMARNGNFALASRSDRHLSQVIAYNGDGNIICRYLFSRRPAVCVSLADSKDAMTVGLLDAQNGDFLSVISRYQFPIENPTASIELPGELILHLNYQDGSNIRAITDQRVILFNSDMKETASFSYGEQQLIRFQYGQDGKLALYLRDATGERKGRAVVLNDHLEALCSVPQNADPNGMALENGILYLSQSGEILLYNFTGKQTGHYAINGLGLIQPMGDTLYYTTGSELCTITSKEIMDRTSQRGSSKNASESSSTASQRRGSSEESESASSSSRRSNSSDAESSKMEQSASDRWAMVKDALLGSESEAASQDGEKTEKISSSQPEASSASEASSISESDPESEVKE